MKINDRKELTQRDRSDHKNSTSFKYYKIYLVCYYIITMIFSSVVHVCIYVLEIEDRT